MVEEWKDIKGYEGKYQISNLGKVRSLIDNRKRKRNEPLIMKPYLDDDKYEIIRLSNEGKSKAFKIHRLVALHFLKNPDNKPMVDHIDTNRRNNYYNNLKWITSKENSNNPNTIINLKRAGIKYKTLYGKPIVDKNNTVYPSIIEASRQLKVSRSYIHNRLKKGTGEFRYAQEM